MPYKVEDAECAKALVDFWWTQKKLRVPCARLAKWSELTKPRGVPSLSIAWRETNDAFVAGWLAKGGK